MTAGHPQLFGVQQSALTTDDIYTPAWIFDSLGIQFDVDVASPPGGIPWIPAATYYDQAADGLVQPWSGRVWMNPPYSNASPWVHRFIDHHHGIAFLPFGRSMWLNRIWNEADGLVVPPGVGSFKWAAGRTMSLSVFLAAFGTECVDALSRIGPVRKIAP